MNSPIIVTGAAGFIGSNLVEELNRRGRQDLLLVDNLGTDEKWKNLVGLRFDDLVAPAQFLDLMARDALPAAQAVVHLGACSSTTERDAAFLLENNYRFTRTACEWALARGARFVYASSAATYGDGSQGYSDDLAAVPSLRPLNMYGYSKHLFDLWALGNGLFDRIAGLKYFNVYGPREAHKDDMRSMVHKAFGQVLSRGWIELFQSDRPEYPDGGQKRDFVYVRDAVDATLFLVEHPETGGLFNCGTGKARTWNDLARAVFKALGRPVDIRYIEMPAKLRGKYQYFTQADMAKLRAAGYDAPFLDLEEAVADYVRLEPPEGL
ncbi:MAG: ADP-glyceromanno-heptose 6-epimerase [Kiritimatiellia bacterium]